MILDYHVPREVLQEALMKNAKPDELWYGRPVLQRDRKGRPLVVKKVAPPRGTRRKVGDLYEDERGQVWRVTSVNDSGADVRQECGRKVGETSTWSRDGFLGNLVDEARLSQLQERRRQESVVARDENRCENCWPGEPGVVEGVDRGRDQHCPDHQVTPEKVKAQREAGLKRQRKEKVAETPETVAEVVRLREVEGKTYKEINAAMGWPVGRGERAYEVYWRAKGE